MFEGVFAQTASFASLVKGRGTAERGGGIPAVSNDAHNHNKIKVFYRFGLEHLTDGNGMNPPTTIVVRPPFDKGGKGTNTPSNYNLSVCKGAE